MSANDRGGPAFPALQFIVPHDLEARHVARLGETQGMSLRDYFAGQALVAMHIRSEGLPDLIAERAYEIADAMIAAREKTV